ncbi:hypothetical protein J2Z21_003335 [Streptomyces griseochromogenes]|uniref:Chaplin domain-containing protein n=1 Tax=Streptomyces griseochromogenes TaxID=68214 RepID=A0A1B1B8L2_9ACTN|nr:hypothetical protein [Streptomyces griseochromogenes]ANP55168.1 hypothetical protein AVL59_41255 [Streptomyces griseochromogenes]MBP2050396.1 hypothetical protein [Streptomyces griseochromogenes]
MPRKFAVLTALALAAVCGSAGVASAHSNTTNATGGDGFSSSPVVVNAPQQGVLVVNGTLVDGRCIAPWSNGAVLAGTVATNPHYAACNTATVNQQQQASYTGGLLF